jgi:hypothetical protein
MTRQIRLLDTSSKTTLASGPRKLPVGAFAADIEYRDGLRETGEHTFEHGEAPPPQLALQPRDENRLDGNLDASSSSSLPQ